MIYLTNRALLEQIALSKLSYCDFSAPQYSRYDEIVFSIDDVVEPGITYRVMTYAHIPLDDNKKTRSRAVGGEGHARVNFPPFQHVIWDGEKTVVVGRSHYSNGKFCLTRGKLTRTLSNQIIKIVTRYAQKANWRDYTWREEMEGAAIMNLTQNALQFNEGKGDNPFAFLTQCIKNSFRRQHAVEQKQLDILDELRCFSGARPSERYLLNHEESQSLQG